MAGSRTPKRLLESAISYMRKTRKFAFFQLAAIASIQQKNTGVWTFSPGQIDEIRRMEAELSEINARLRRLETRMATLHRLAA
jgi:hypothetical protein